MYCSLFQYILLHRFLLLMSHLLLLIPLFHLLCPCHGSLLIEIGLSITWEKWMLSVQTVGLCTGNVRSWLAFINLAHAVPVERSKFQNLMIHHQSFSIFSQARRMYVRFRRISGLTLRAIIECKLRTIGRYQ